MITDEERREVVARLREWLAIPWYERPWSRDAMQSLGKMVGAVPGENIVERLADLIDRPTCTIVNSWQEITPGLGELDLSDMCGFELSCGHEVNGYEKPHYCSECGAVVVDED